MVVYFDPASGDTHLISAFACYLMHQLAEKTSPLETIDILKLVSNDIEPEDLHELEQAIPGILEELASLDILAQT
jgi:hypothetical protein